MLPKLASVRRTSDALPREAARWDTDYLPLGYVLASRGEGEEARRGMPGSGAGAEWRLERLLEKNFLATDPDTWPMKVVMARTEEGDLRPFVKTLKTGEVNSKTDGDCKVTDNAKEENVEGKEKNVEGKVEPKDRNMMKVC